MKSFANVLQNRSSHKFPDIRKKIFVLESLFNFIKKETPTQVFLYDYHKMFENSFFMEHLQWLLLKMVEEFLIQLEKYLYSRI